MSLQWFSTSAAHTLAWRAATRRGSKNTESDWMQKAIKEEAKPTIEAPDFWHFSARASAVTSGGSHRGADTAWCMLLYVACILEPWPRKKMKKIKIEI